MPLSKSKLKALCAYRQTKVCEEENVFVIEGEKSVMEAIVAGVDIKRICAKVEWLEQNMERLPRGAETLEVTEEELERLSSMRQPNKVWMTASRELPDIGLTDNGLVLALDRLQDPGNMGTLVRTADWFGVRRIVCSRDTVSRYNPKVVQSSMGSLFRVKVEYVDLAEWLGVCGMPVYGATLDGEDVRKATLDRPAVLVIGNEGRGISPEVSEHVSHKVKIPNTGGTCESLNAAVATAVLISQWAM